MEEKKSNRSLWIILAVTVGLLLICGVSAVAGGMAGYMAGKRAAANERSRDMWREIPELEIPTPRVPENLPELELPSLGQGGALVTEVVEDSPAERAGLRKGDIILEINGETLSEVGLSEMLSAYDPGDEIELLIWRRGQERNVAVTLGRHPNKGGETPCLGIYYQQVSSGEFRLPQHRKDN